MNRWKIPKWLETHVLERDKDCTYCRATFELAVWLDSPYRKSRSITQEHVAEGVCAQLLPNVNEFL